MHRRTRDHEGGVAGLGDGLGGDSPAPEDGDFAGVDFRGFAPVRLFDVVDADDGGVAGVGGSAVDTEDCLGGLVAEGSVVRHGLLRQAQNRPPRTPARPLRQAQGGLSRGLRDGQMGQWKGVGKWRAVRP